MANTALIDTYEATVASVEETTLDGRLEEARRYNAELFSGGADAALARRVQALNDQSGQVGGIASDAAAEAAYERYRSLLSVDGTALMGYVTIPQLKLELPIYHGTGEAELQSGAGHLIGTSLPVGGPSTHCVIAAHSGLATAELFSHLADLRRGDEFSLTVLGQRLVYKVDRITVVLPDEVDELAIEPGRDLCTLLTCTPYGINTHRLLVRGHRIPVEEAANAPARIEHDDAGLIGAGLAVAAVIAAALLIRRAFVRRRPKAHRW